jgi:putative oxidoreductase
MSDATLTSPTALTALRARYVALRRPAEHVPFSLIQLAMRIAIGFVFFNSGLLKARSWDFAVRLFRDEYRLPLLPPELAAQLAIAFEISMPVLLFAGLATRLATLPLIGMTIVIVTLVYPSSWVESLLWLSILLTLLTRGPGVLSLDYLIERRLARSQR